MSVATFWRQFFFVFQHDIAPRKARPQFGVEDFTGTHWLPDLSLNQKPMRCLKEPDRIVRHDRLTSPTILWLWSPQLGSKIQWKAFFFYEKSVGRLPRINIRGFERDCQQSNILLIVHMSTYFRPHDVFLSWLGAHWWKMTLVMALLMFELIFFQVVANLE